MISSSLALQQAIVATLSTDAAVLASLGGARLYDDTPQPAAFPYATIAQTTARSIDADLASTDEHIVTLHVWSRARGRREALAIVEAIRHALHDRPLTLVDHALVNLRHDYSEARRERDGDTIRGLARFRAVTEPL